jgi:flagellar P-ring protein precursor FlgI
MRGLFITGLFVFIAAGLFAESVPLKNIISIEGMQVNPVLGYGIVVGLKGTGDSTTGSQTKEVLSMIANNFGFYVDPMLLKPKNSAIVLVSAQLPPFAPIGSHVDVSVASVFDAKSLEGGELIITPLLGGDNQIYAIAQGRLMVENGSKSVTGIVPLGGIVQEEIFHQITDTNGQLTIYVNEKLGMGVVSKVKETIQKKYPDAITKVQNYKIRMKIPAGMEIYDFIFELNKMSVDIDQEPRVLIDAKQGVIVSGGNVMITEAAVSFKGTKVQVGGGAASWGGSSGGQNASETVKVMKSSATVAELADGLNKLGASTDEIITILQLLYKNGNLKGKLEIQ